MRSHVSAADLARQREVVAAFLAASRHGDFEALLAVLDPDIILRAARAAAQTGASSEVRGAPTVADTFSGRARFTQPALVNGAAGAVWAPADGRESYSASRSGAGRSSRSTWSPTPARLRQLDLMTLED